MSKKLTIIKILSEDPITQQDIERWRKIFEEHAITEEEMVQSGEVDIQHLDFSEDEPAITFIKVGNDDYHPSPEDLEAWRDIFEEAGERPRLQDLHPLRR